MEAMWEFYINFLNFRTTMPMTAFILATSIASLDYPKNKNPLRAIFISLGGGLIGYGILFLFSLCTGLKFPACWKNICELIKWLVAIILFFTLMVQTSEDFDFMFSGIISFFVGLITYYIVFYLGTFLIPLIKYLFGYIIFHGIFLLMFPIIVIIAATVIFKNMIQDRGPMTLFAYALLLEIFFLINPILSSGIQAFLSHILFFITPFIAVALILWWKRTSVVWIISFILLLGVTIIQMCRFFILSGYTTRLKTFFNFYPFEVILSYILLLISLSAYYLYNLWKTGEKRIDKIHVLWLFFAVLLNAIYLVPIILGIYGFLWKNFIMKNFFYFYFVMVNIFIGIGILLSRWYISLNALQE